MGLKLHLSDLNRFHQPTGREKAKDIARFISHNVRLPDYPPFTLSRNMSHIYDNQCVKVTGSGLRPYRLGIPITTGINSIVIEKYLELSEKDVINVLEIVLNEYPVDRSSMFLTGHSMGSGGTWYLGAKYAQYWAAIAPMSGPFVDESNYPWDNIRKMPIFMTEGTGATPSLVGSKAMLAWMKERGFKIEYMEVNADHGGMILLVLPSVFNFFDRCRSK